MIAASAVLVVVAFITLIIGIFQTGLGLIWMSIAASVLAAIFLLLGVVRGRPPKIAVAGGPEPESWSEGASTYQEPAATTWEQAETAAPEAPTVEVEPEEVAPAPAPRRAPARPATRPSAGRATASRAGASRARTGTAARSTAGLKQVIVIPDRDKFHAAGCRYAKGAGAMKMTKPEARREGYKPCGVCKP